MTDERTLSVVETRVFPAPVERVWGAWTEPRMLERWIWGSIGRDERAEVDARLGGAFRVSTRNADGATFAMRGEFVAFEPHRKLVCTLAWDAPMGYPPSPERLIVELAPVAGGTELRFEHAGIPNAAARDEHARGWADVFQRLALVLAE
ncbi:MAG: SRPBCC domain-containing protein [Phycisphaerales bacterium]|nr:SRPBCC domain-containing protein [Phycisphaerales bacterium]